MYIRRKVFSLLQDEMGEERYFSTTDFEITDGEQKDFAKKEKKPNKKKRRALEDVESHRGLGRSILLGGPSPAGALGGFAGKMKANKLDKEGKSDKEILEGASKHGAKVGAGLGAGLIAGKAISEAIAYPKGMKKLAVSGNLVPAALVSGFGALGGYLGAKKNTKTRLEKRKYRKVEEDED